MYVRYSLEYSLKTLIPDGVANIMQSTYSIALLVSCNKAIHVFHVGVPLSDTLYLKEIGCPV